MAEFFPWSAHLPSETVIITISSGAVYTTETSIPIQRPELLRLEGTSVIRVLTAQLCGPRLRPSDSRGPGRSWGAQLP